MTVVTRKILDKSFTFGGLFTLVLMAAALLCILLPIFIRGAGAVVFCATNEHRRIEFEEFQRGSSATVSAEMQQRARLIAPIAAAVKSFEETGLDKYRGKQKRELRAEFNDLKAALAKLFGPLPGDEIPALLRRQYGQTRLDRAREELHHVLRKEVWDYPIDAQGNQLAGQLIVTDRAEVFKGTALEAMFPYLERNFEAIVQPKLTFYWPFFTSVSKDSHFFGGIFPELLGTFYLTIGAMLFAVPIGVLSAVYLTEYTRQGTIVNIIRTCINTLAGVPSIVFGLFGLTFFIVTLHVSNGKSVLAGAMTLSLLVLPTIIRAAEEAIKAVPASYKEAALSLGATKWHAIATVVLPAALPGVLTGIVISMGRAAGETAPIIFTAAVSMGGIVGLGQVLDTPTPALSWNIYNLVSEHEAVNEIRHVQYGMVATLIVLVLLLNLAAIVIRSHVAKKLKG